MHTSTVPNERPDEEKELGAYFPRVRVDDRSEAKSDGYVTAASRPEGGSRLMVV